MVQLLANAICKGGAYAPVAIAFGLIYRTTGVFHIALGAIYTIAAYVLYVLLVEARLPFSVALITSLGAAGITGMLLEVLVHRPLEKQKASGAVNLISSIGAYIVLVNLIGMIAGNEVKVLRSGIQSSLTLGSISLTWIQVAQFCIGWALIAMYWLFLRATPLGRTCRAIADDVTLAAVLGVRVDETRVAVSIIGSVMAGLGSILVALDVGIDPYGGFNVLMVGIVASIIGGLNHLVAPALGVFLIVVFQSVVVWLTSAKWENAVVSVLLIVILLVRPRGVVGMNNRAGNK